MAILDGDQTQVILHIVHTKHHLTKNYIQQRRKIPFLFEDLLNGSTHEAAAITNNDLPLHRTSKIEHREESKREPTAKRSRLIDPTRAFCFSKNPLIL